MSVVRCTRGGVEMGLQPVVPANCRAANEPNSFGATEHEGEEAESLLARSLSLPGDDPPPDPLFCMTSPLA